ncbi:MAG: uridylate kinase [Methylococcaceae bacterium]|nr:uridylate kinase [Methylococcaceae bacterium]
MRIIKLGGSLLDNKSLVTCLTHIQNNPTSTLIVTGGGAFAEQVRIAQQQWQFNDVAAHHMAILAMQQMALLVNALQPDWRLLQSFSDLQSWHTQNRIGLWFPDITLLNAQGIAASWRVTSDSLAAWLAGATQANELIIVKAAEFSVTASTAELVALEVLDQAFLGYIKPARFVTTIINSHDFIQQILMP